MFNVPRLMKEMPGALKMLRAGKLPIGAGDPAGLPGLAQDERHGPGAERHPQVRIAEADEAGGEGLHGTEVRILARLRLEGRGARAVSSRRTASRAELGIELVELDQATCTGAGVIQEQNPEMARRAERAHIRAGAAARACR